jgi:hypothetical protein
MNTDEPLSEVHFLKIFGRRVRLGDSDRDRVCICPWVLPLRNGHGLAPLSDDPADRCGGGRLRVPQRPEHAATIVRLDCRLIGQTNRATSLRTQLGLLLPSPEDHAEHIATLTPREREVFELIVRGQTNKHAARSLGCSERTIKAHRQLASIDSDQFWDRGDAALFVSEPSGVQILSCWLITRILIDLDQASVAALTP